MDEGRKVTAELDRLRRPAPAWAMWLAVAVVWTASALIMFCVTDGAAP